MFLNRPAVRSLGEARRRELGPSRVRQYLLSTISHSKQQQPGSPLIRILSSAVVLGAQFSGLDKSETRPELQVVAVGLWSRCIPTELSWTTCADSGPRLIVNGQERKKKSLCAEQQRQAFCWTAIDSGSPNDQVLAAALLTTPGQLVSENSAVLGGCFIAQV